MHWLPVVTRTGNPPPRALVERIGVGIR